MPVKETLILFNENKNPEQAFHMAAYMKNHFPFLGLSKPQRTLLQRKFIKDAKKQKAIDWQMIIMLWDFPEREFQYLAVDYLMALRGSLQKADIVHIGSLITSKSWWDTVDALASNIIGALCLKQPEVVESHILEWAASDNIWLVRTAILFQLKYKTRTDTDLLASIILKNCSTKEFFINKAIGWALREYSKTNRAWVQTFVDSNALQPLSLREASKYL